MLKKISGVLNVLGILFTSFGTILACVKFMVDLKQKTKMGY